MEPTGDFGLQIDMVVDHGEADLSDVRLHYVEAGDPNGPLVVLLHGFPEFWYSWRHQLVALSQAGYHVVAPDQRGYNTSDKPSRVSDYTIDQLAGDVRDLIDHFGEESACIVGHDWGAEVAWFFAMIYPERTRRLTIMNVPHPVTMRNGLRTLRQLRKSWYMGFFQIPALPEKALSANDFRRVRDVFANDPVNEFAFTEEDIDLYVEALAQPGALEGAINWYRAAPRTKWRRFVGAIECPTMVIWGTQDKHLGEELAEPPEHLVPDCRVERLDDASHWVQCDRPDKVNALLLHFLAQD